MKKHLLLFAAGLLACGATCAQGEVENLTLDGGWGSSVGCGSSAQVSFPKAWGQFTLVGSAISTDDYTAIKLTVDGVAVGELQLKIADSDGKESYPAVVNGDNTIGLTNLKNSSDEALGSSLSYIDLQSKSIIANPVEIKSVSLVNKSGEEEPVAALAGVRWNCGVVGAMSLNITSQWGCKAIQTLDGQAVTYDPAANPNDVYTYTIELEEAPAYGAMVEVDYKKGEADTCLFTAGYLDSNNPTTLTFEVSAANCEKAVSNIYIKDNDWKNVAVFPYAIKIKSITRVKTSVETALPALPADAVVVSTEYVSLSGVVSATPQRGVNIVRQTLSDGSTRVVKAVEK